MALRIWLNGFTLGLVVGAAIPLAIWNLFG